jgi:hypothetical protein
MLDGNYGYNNPIPHFYDNGFGFGIYEYYAPSWAYDCCDSGGVRHTLEKDYVEPIKFILKYDGTTAYWESVLGSWTQTLNLDITQYKLKIAAGGHSTSDYIKVDYIFIRKYADQEPTYTIGTLQYTNTTIISATLQQLT